MNTQQLPDIVSSAINLFLKGFLVEINEIKARIEQLEDKINSQTINVNHNLYQLNKNLEAIKTSLTQTEKPPLPINVTPITNLNNTTNIIKEDKNLLTATTDKQNNPKTITQKQFILNINKEDIKNLISVTTKIIPPKIPKSLTPKKFILNKETAMGFQQKIQSKLSSLKIKDLHKNHHKVIAGIIMSRKLSNSCELISLSMGTKCIFGENLSRTGDAINDMHAEVIARRCLVSYFYHQLELISQNHSSIFELRQQGHGYKLKDGIQFHLYISTVPCGDATVKANQKKVACLRTKIEATEGTFVVDNEDQQSMKKIKKGRKLRTMSCSDKICRWNVVGLQGALLAHFIEPIYLTSIIIGDWADLDQVRRATYKRIEPIDNLPTSYRVNRPTILVLSSKVIQQVGNAPNFSVLWSIDKNQAEKISRNGLIAETRQQSVYCKEEFLNRFLQLTNNISSLTKIEDDNLGLYCELKNKSVLYKEAKRILLERFSSAGLGNWISKPQSLDQF